MNYFAVPALKRFPKEINKGIAHTILWKLSEIYGLSYENIISRSRRAEYVYIRHLFFFYTKEMFTNFTLARIGRYLNLDHTTVISGLSTFKDAISTKEELPKRLLRGVGTCDTDYLNTSKILTEFLK